MSFRITRRRRFRSTLTHTRTLHTTRVSREVRFPIRHLLTTVKCDGRDRVDPNSKAKKKVTHILTQSYIVYATSFVLPYVPRYEYSAIGPNTRIFSIVSHSFFDCEYIVFHCCVVLAFCMHCYKCVCVFPCLPLLVRMCLDLRMWFNCFFLPILSLKYILYVCGCVECMVRIIRNESIILQLCFAIRRAIKLYTTPVIVCMHSYCWHPALC